MSLEEQLVKATHNARTYMEAYDSIVFPIQRAINSDPFKYSSVEVRYKGGVFEAEVFYKRDKNNDARVYLRENSTYDDLNLNLNAIDFQTLRQISTFMSSLLNGSERLIEYNRFLFDKLIKIAKSFDMDAVYPPLTNVSYASRFSEKDLTNSNLYLDSPPWPNAFILIGKDMGLVLESVLDSDRPVPYLEIYYLGNLDFLLDILHELVPVFKKTREFRKEIYKIVAETLRSLHQTSSY